MGSQNVQSNLWGKRAEDWANFQEPTHIVVYKYVLDLLQLQSTDKLLDVGCGSGWFCKLASAESAAVTGFDGTEALIEQAKKRVADINFFVGEMEALPFEDRTFNVVTGFNSFQYAANVKNALMEAKRVLKDDGKLVVNIWGNKEDCEAATYLKAVGSLLPPPPPGAGGPFALSENNLLENILEEVGFKIFINTDIDGIWDYENKEIALKGLMSSGPVAKAVENSGYEKVFETVSNAMQPYIQTNGHVVYKNKFRVVVAEKINY